MKLVNEYDKDNLPNLLYKNDTFYSISVINMFDTKTTIADEP